VCFVSRVLCRRPLRHFRRGTDASGSGTSPEAGRSRALPRLKLEEAEQALANSKDEEILQRTLYGEVSIEDLTGEQAGEMIDAAGG